MTSSLNPIGYQRPRVHMGVVKRPSLNAVQPRCWAIHAHQGRAITPEILTGAIRRYSRRRDTVATAAPLRQRRPDSIFGRRGKIARWPSIKTIVATFPP